MTRFLKHLRSLAATVLTGGLALIIAGSSAQTTPTNATVDLSLGPIATSAQAVNIALALSVEFPTVGAAYRTPNYSHTTVYLGYFDATGCYAYKDGGAGAPIGGQYFYRTGNVDASGYCDNASSGAGKYSGNLLNYVTASSIDLLRYALTGGNRVVDTADATILERAYLRNVWNLHNSNFPSKRIPAALVGKVTPAMTKPTGEAVTGDVIAGGCWDRVYFGTSSTSVGCANAETTTSGNLNPRAPGGSIQTGRVPVGTPIPSTAIGAVTTTVSWEVSNPLVTSTVAPTNGGPTNDTFTYYVAIPGETLTPAPTGSGLSNATVSLSYTPVTVAPTTATAPVPTSTYPTLGAEPNRSVLGYTTATLAIGIVDTNAIPDTATTTSEPLVITNNSTTRGYKVCAFGTVPNPTRIGGKTQSGSVTNSGVDQAWCTANFPGSTQTTLGTILDWKANQSKSITFNRNIRRTAYYQAYTVNKYVQNWEARTGWNVYQQWQYYTYYPTEAPAPMYARVRVCDSIEATLRDDLCVRYPQGNYKPIGEIQRYAKGVRVAAFGYLKDDAITAYGGVLRAPMKYPGPTYTDPKGLPQTNDQTEWDSETGIFKVDPMSAATGAPSYAMSGVINYLNKFGTANTAAKGYYKTYDPVGELYYEALRYFQGLPPSAQAIAPYNSNPDSADGFPVYTSVPTSATSTTSPAPNGWADPLQNACERRNFILAIGDVNTHVDKQLPGHMSPNGVNNTGNGDTARSAEPLKGSAGDTFNAVDWTKVLAGFETNTAVSYVDAGGTARSTLGNPNPYANNSNLSTKCTGATCAGYYWAGAAYWANTQPIRKDNDADGQSMKDIRVKTFTVDVDEYGNGSIEDDNPRGIRPRASSFYLAGKYGWFNDANLDGNPFTTAGATNNTEWQDPAAPNTPDGYVIASQAQKMIDGIRKFFKTASTQRGAASVSAISSARYTADAPNGDFFAPQFNVSDWSGTVQRSKLALNTTTGTVESTNELIWDAGVILNNASIATGAVVEPMVKPADRNIITLSTDTVTKGVLFDVANKGQFDAAVLAELGKDPASGSTDTLTDARINFIRGDRSNEGPSSVGKFRQRGSPMGDVINSGPVYKQSADPGLTGAGYQAFAYSVKDRGATIYVGANDGMMHAFRADDGKELFAYIPRAVATRLNKLTNPKYLHQPYVDGVPLVGEAKVGANWKTLLVSGMGGGAQGIFALDVTDPTAFGVGNVMFEFTDADDPAMGNVLTQPALVKLKIPPVAPATTPTYKWFIAVGSGYNNYKSDSNPSLTGEQALFFLSVDKNPGENWQEGSNYFKILVPVASTTAANGMLNPGFAKDASGVATILYAGDLQGNMWRFDLSDGLNTSGIANAVQLSAGAKIPLFVATDAGGNRQPITTSPQVVEANAYGHMVVFGTGKFVEASDTSTTQSQAIYGIWDSAETQAARFTVPKTKLFQRTSTTVGETVKLTLGGFTYGNAAATETSSSVYRGWYLNLPTAKERIAVESVVGIGAVIFASAIPEGACSGDGSGRKYCLNPVDGSSTCGDFTTTIGIPSGPKIFQIELDDSSYTARSPTGRRTVTIEQQAISSSTKITDAGNALVSGTKLQSISIPAGRLSWRELRN